MADLFVSRIAQSWFEMSIEVKFVSAYEAKGKGGK